MCGSPTGLYWSAHTAGPAVSGPHWLNSALMSLELSGWWHTAWAPCPRLVSCSVLSLEVLEGDNKNTHTRCVQTHVVSSLRVCFTRSLPQISLSSLCVRMCAHECKCRQRPAASDPLVPEPVVGTELRSSVRAVPALSSRATSSPVWPSFECTNCFYLSIQLWFY